MYRKANINDVEKITKITQDQMTKEEIMDYINKGQKYLYVYEQEEGIVGATFLVHKI